MTKVGRAGLLARGAVVLLALALLLLAYYQVHKPLDMALALSLGGAALDLLAAGGLFLVAGAIGRRAVGAAGAWPVERVALEPLLGLGVIGSVALLLGLAGLFTGLIFLPALAAAGLLLRRQAAAWLADLRRLVAASVPGDTWTRWLAALSAVLLALALARALGPPYAWDAMTYHLVAPDRYLADGRIAADPDNVFMGFPQLAEVLYGVAMSLFARDTAAAVVHFGFGVLGLLALAGFARQAVTGWVSIALVLSAHSMWALFGMPYVDLAVFAFSAGAFAAVLRWRDTRAESLLVAAGLLAGFAVGVKYTAAGLLLSLGLFVIWYGRGRLPRSLALLGGPALAALLPWLVKGMLLYGNPVYPFLFGGLNWDALRGATFSTAGQGLLGSPEVWQLAALPLAATVLGVEKGAGFGFTAGPWLLVAPILLLPAWRWLRVESRRRAGRLVLLAAPLLLAWAAVAALSGIGMQTRLAMPLLPLAAALGAVAFGGLAAWPEKPVHIGFVARVIFALTLLLGAGEAARETLREGAPDALLALHRRDTFLDAALQAHAGAMRALSTLPAGSQVRLLWEPRSYYCPRAVRCRPDILLDHWARPLRLGARPGDVFQSWRDEGDDYLLLWHAGHEQALSDPRFAAENARFLDARDAWLTPIWTDGVRYTLYGWRPPAGL